MIEIQFNQVNDIYKRLTKDPTQVRDDSLFIIILTSFTFSYISTKIAKRPLLQGDDPLKKLLEISERRRQKYLQVRMLNVLTNIPYCG